MVFPKLINECFLPAMTDVFRAYDKKQIQLHNSYCSFTEMEKFWLVF